MLGGGRLSVVFLIHILLSTSASSQTGTITGTVSLPDTSDWNGISVVVLGQNRATVTSANGQFTIPGVTAGAVSVQAGKLYYSNARKDTTLSSGQTLTLSLALTGNVQDTMLVQQNAQFTTGITNNGNIGALNHFVEPSDPGFTFGGQQQMFEASLMVGVDTNRVSDAARFILGVAQDNLDQDFQSLSDVVVLTQGPDSSEYVTAFDDSRSNLPPGIPSQPLGLRIIQKTYSYGASSLNSSLIVELTFTNTSVVTIQNILVGWFVDWDVAPTAGMNRGETLVLQNTIPGIRGGQPFDMEVAYQRNASSGNTFMGIVPLSQAKFRASRSASNTMEIYPDAPNRGLTEANKYRTMATRRSTSPMGDLGSEEDLSTLVSVGGLATGQYETSSLTLLPGASVTAGFAFVGGSDSLGFLQDARDVQRKWVELGRNLVITSLSIEDPSVPARAYLEQNYPNPFNPTTTLRFGLPTGGHASLSVYNILGEKVRTLLEEERSSGEFEVLWDGKDERGRDVASGLYFAQLRYSRRGAIEVHSLSRKLLLLR